MLEAFTNGEDIYLRTAAKLVGEERAVEARPAAKRVTLGFLYGLGVDKYRINVYKDTGEPLSGEQAVKDRQAFRAAFPTFYNWQKRYGARKEWETRSVLGWRRVVSPSKDREGNTVPKYTERLNGPIQSTAGDILYLTLEKIAQDPRGDTLFLLSVHDELVLECPEADARDVALWLKEKMRSSIEDVLGKDLGGEKSVEVSYGPVCTAVVGIAGVPSRVQRPGVREGYSPQSSKRGRSWFMQTSELPLPRSEGVMVMNLSDLSMSSWLRSSSRTRRQTRSYWDFSPYEAGSFGPPAVSSLSPASSR